MDLTSQGQYCDLLPYYVVCYEVIGPTMVIWHVLDHYHLNCKLHSDTGVDIAASSVSSIIRRLNAVDI